MKSVFCQPVNLNNMFPNDSRSLSRATDIHQAELFKYKDIRYLRKNMFGFPF